MGISEKLKTLILKNSETSESADPWAAAPTPKTENANPWKQAPAPKPPSTVDVWKTPTRIGKNWVLHKLAFAVILLNVALGLFFTSNNPQFNAALYTYLGVSTIIVAHYWGMTR